MSEYSDELDSYAMMIDPSDNDYEKKLKEVANRFRGFNAACPCERLLGAQENSSDGKK